MIGPVDTLLSKNQLPAKQGTIVSKAEKSISSASNQPLAKQGTIASKASSLINEEKKDNDGPATSILHKTESIAPAKVPAKTDKKNEVAEAMKKVALVKDQLDNVKKIEPKKDSEGAVGGPSKGSAGVQ